MNSRTPTHLERYFTLDKAMEAARQQSVRLGVRHRVSIVQPLLPWGRRWYRVTPLVAEPCS